MTSTYHSSCSLDSAQGNYIHQQAKQTVAALRMQLSYSHVEAVVAGQLEQVCLSSAAAITAELV